MEKRIHPTHQKSLQRTFIAIWLIGAISFAAALLLHKSGLPTLGWLFSGVFGFSILGGLVYLTYLKYHVTCAACNGKTTTTKDSTQSKWVAVCTPCQIAWDLQTDVAGD